MANSSNDGARSWGRPVAKVALTVAVLATLALGCARSEDAPTASPDTTNNAGQVVITAPADANAKPQKGGKLVYGIEAETDGYDPSGNRWAISGTMVANAVLDPIAAFDKDLNPRPYLAESIEHNADYTEWTVKFRPGITFHNGQPLNADAGNKFTEAIKTSDLTGPAALPIESIEKVDDLTGKIKMNRPWVSFPNLITAQGGLMVAPEQLDQPKNSAARTAHPIGTGPFVFKEWVRDSKFVATRNPNYWQKDKDGNQLPYLEEVEFRPTPDPQSRVNSLETGDINALHNSSQTQVPRLKQLATDGKANYYAGGGEDEESFIMINTQEPPLSDKKLRQALAYATDITAVENVTGDVPEQRADGPFNKSNPYYSPTGFPGFDPAKAKQLVDEWKAANGGATPSFVFATTSVLENQQVAQVLEKLWDEAGFDVAIETYDQTKFILQAVTGQFQVVAFRQFSSPDPDGEWHWWSSRNATAKGTLGLNFARFKIPELDQAMDDGRSNPDPAARKADYAKVGKIFADEVPYIWLHHVQWAIVTAPKVHDILNQYLPGPQFTPANPVQAGVHRLTYAWIDQ